MAEDWKARILHARQGYELRRGTIGVRTPLAAFLTKTRAGHCEYFATATVLLLREAADRCLGPLGRDSG